MARLPVFTEQNGELIRMRPSAPRTEDSLQELIARYPAVISGEDEDLLLVRREAAVPDAVDGSGRWSLDHLFVTRGAIPVLVEVKRATDTRLRREVIGQLLDYAANGVSHWGAGALEANFVATCESDTVEPGTRLSEFLQDEDVEHFWRQVDANLSAGNVRLIVAADVIPSELARVIEFLNDQMRATVLGVELNYFEAVDGARTLVPRIVGETERAAQAKGRSRDKLEPITLDEWLEKNIYPLGQEVVAGAHRHLDMMCELGADCEVASTQGSIVATLKGADNKSIYPLFLGKDGRLAIGFGWLLHRDATKPDEVRQGLLERFDQAVGGLSTKNPKGHPAFPVARLDDDVICRRYEAVVRDLLKLLQNSLHYRHGE